MSRAIRDTHHRKPRSLGGDDSPRNLSNVLRVEHEAWHVLFANWSPAQIARTINTYWLDHDFKMVAVPVEHLSAVEEFLKRRKT